MWFPNETTESNRQTIISVIAHEFAHQWYVRTTEFKLTS